MSVRIAAELKETRRKSDSSKENESVTRKDCEHRSQPQVGRLMKGRKRDIKTAKILSLEAAFKANLFDSDVRSIMATPVSALGW